MTSSNVLAIIPARGGSKGLPGKNIIDFCGKPLIAWSIDSCIDASCVSHVVVSSDDDEILKVAEAYGANSIKRPKELSTDQASVIPVVEHVLSLLKDKLFNFDYLALIQPTSPLRTSTHIEDAYELLRNSQVDSVIGVAEVDSEVLKYFVVENGHLTGIRNNDYPFCRRQDLPKVYKPNGAIYIVKTDIFLRDKAFITDSTIPYVMEEDVSLDIDTKEDLQKAERYFLQ